MRPIVDGIKKEYRACIDLQRVNFHAESDMEKLIGPVGTPEFALLDKSKNIIYRWVGFTEKEEFTQQLDPLCKG